MPLQTYPPGSYEVDAQSLRGPCYGWRVDFDLSAWSIDPSTEVDFEILLSEDDGGTWISGGGAGVRGNAFVDRNGNPVTASYFRTQASVHEYDANNKFVRLASVWKTALLAKVALAVRNATIRTSVDLAALRTINTQQNTPDLHHSIGIGVHSSAHGGDAIGVITTPAVTTQVSGSTGVVDGLFFSGFDPGGGAPAFSSFQDSKINSWTTSVAEHTNANAIKARQAYKAGMVGGSGHTFTLNVTNTVSYPEIAFTEIIGAAASPLDKTATGTDASGTNHGTSNTASLAQAAELVLQFGGITDVATGSVGGTWTQLESLSHDGTVEGLITAYRVVSATSAVAGLFSTNNSVATENHVSTWKEAAVVSSFFPPFPIFDRGLIQR